MTLHARTHHATHEFWARQPCQLMNFSQRSPSSRHFSNDTSSSKQQHEQGGCVPAQHGIARAPDARSGQLQVEGHGQAGHPPANNSINKEGARARHASGQLTTRVSRPFIMRMLPANTNPPRRMERGRLKTWRVMKLSTSVLGD